MICFARYGDYYYACEHSELFEFMLDQILCIESKSEDESKNFGTHKNIRKRGKKKPSDGIVDDNDDDEK